MMMNSYFELNVVRLLEDDKVYNDERIRFHSLVEAEHEMLRISKVLLSLNRRPSSVLSSVRSPLG